MMITREGQLTVNEVQASVVAITSDRRLKTEVTPLTDVLEKLTELRGVSYDWNDQAKALGRATGRREIGVIAQEVEAVFPELVTTWGDEGYKAVEYGKLTGVLIEAVKELRAEKDAQIVALRTEKDGQIAALEARLAILEQVVAKHSASGVVTSSVLPGSALLMGGLVLAGLVRKHREYGRGQR
jgi:hypothetical protein